MENFLSSCGKLWSRQEQRRPTETASPKATEQFRKTERPPCRRACRQPPTNAGARPRNWVVLTPTAPPYGKQGSARARSGKEIAWQLAATPPAAPPQAPDGAGRRSTGLQKRQFSAIRRRKVKGAPAESASATEIGGTRPAAELQKILFLYNCPAPLRAARAALLACTVQTFSVVPRKHVRAAFLQAPSGRQPRKVPKIKKTTPFLKSTQF